MTKELKELFLAGLEQNQQKLYRICSAYSENSEDTKDLFQEAVMNIWQSMSSFRKEAAIGSWMFRITLNVCLRINSKRVKKRNQFIALQGIAFQPIAEEPRSEVHPQLKFLKNCIQQLNEVDKALISLYLEELSYKEISNITGLKENTIAVKIKRIKAKLLTCLKKES